MGRNEQRKPWLLEVSAVGEDILALRVQEGWVEGGVQEPYVPQEGESLRQDARIPYLTWIEKDGKPVTTLVKDTQKGDQRFVLETRLGADLDTALADNPASYTVNGERPLAVWRKSKANNIADPSYEETLLHVLYLVLQKPLEEGKEYALGFASGLLDAETARFTFRPASQRSEAVHVSQLGFRPGDPSKVAYLSQWMGLGGGIRYDRYQQFHLVEDATGTIVYTGKVRFQHDGEPVVFHNHCRLNGESDELTTHTSVYEMDFSDFNTPGTYRVFVPGLGCGFPFAIDERETWLRGFKLSMNALYCQRSGTVTGEPYTSFSRPRVYHPDDGRVIRQSRCSLMESGNGLNCYGTDVNNFGNLVRKATDEVVENAWGGTFDACDWDRRIQHLRATQLLTELYLMFPDYYGELRLPIPESGNGLPDILNEGLYNVDFYRRLQLPDGGIRGGIEAEEHPILGECGWQDSWPAWAYAPDFWSSHWYASAAARMAFALRPIDPEKSAVYQESAQRAMDWAEEQYPRLLASEGHKWTPSAHQRIRDTRELAAVDMYRLTGEAKYDALYRQLRQEHSYEAAFVYATLPGGMGDGETRQACVHTILQAAERALAFGEKAPYHLTTPDPEITSTGSFSSFYTVSKMTELARAHYLTGDSCYLAAAVASCGFGSGANPDNLCYTTGAGVRNVVNILHHDSRITGQPAPAGITVAGPQNMRFSNRDGFIPNLRNDRFWPGVYAWPAAESYFDAYRIAVENEYTVQGSIGPNLYNWGYLAAAKE